MNPNGTLEDQLSFVLAADHTSSAYVLLQSMYATPVIHDWALLQQSATETKGAVPWE